MKLLQYYLWDLLYSFGAYSQVPHKHKDPTFWFRGPRQGGFQKPTCDLGIHVTCTICHILYTIHFTQGTMHSITYKDLPHTIYCSNQILYITLRSVCPCRLLGAPRCPHGRSFPGNRFARIARICASITSSGFLPSWNSKRFLAEPPKTQFELVNHTTREREREKGRDRYVFVYVCRYIHTRICMYTCEYVCICMDTRMNMHVYVCIGMYVYAYVCLCIWAGAYPPLHFVTFPNRMSLGSLGLGV